MATSGAPETRSGARSILLVEDEATLRETLAYALEQDGYRVVTAGDGRTGLALFRSEQPDLVLLDLMLPELSGMEVCRAIRQESQVPIVMLTARSGEIDKVVGLELGADDYVTKPFSLRELQARIRAVLRRSEARGAQDRATDEPAATGGEAGARELGRVTVDLEGHRLLRDGRALPVKPKAFELLSFLLRNSGQVFTREQLLAQVWGYEFAGESRTVDVHVHWLRRHIEENPADPRHLQTVRGVGYVLRREP